MPRKAKAAQPEAEVTEPETRPVEAAPVLPRGAKTAAIKAALKVHSKASPKDIAEALTASGMTTTAAQVSNVKFLLASKRRAKAAPAPTVEAAAAPAVPKDAVSLGLLQKAKKLATQFSSIKEAKAAIDALSVLMD